ncbi:TolC family protein [Segetibacter koreensis]|uniref:TolC family protein n=1 Tax=Segetibacter koreensis TaxID=398037 RepID=UPI0003715B34|nr:TolC family protein [Segetibacter koreensis]
MKPQLRLLSIVLYCISPILIHAQLKSQDTILHEATLQECIQYALKHQPVLHQSQIDEEITETTIKTALSDWYPQVNATYNLQHALQLPTSFFPDANGNKRPTRIGVKNTSNIQFTLNQSIFNPDLLLASKTAGDVRKQARQSTTSNKIDVVVEVSKAYYNLLLSKQQVKVLDENIVRLERSLRDAYNQYQGGIVDKTDYKRAQIALNNTRADRKRAREQVEAHYSNLKQLIGYPIQNTFSVVYDSLQMEREVFIDTLQQVQTNNRIEYQLLQTQQSLLQANVKYNKWSYLPTVSAFANYIPTFQSDRFTNLYNHVYPSSAIGLQVTVPIFQGRKRVYNVRNANLQLLRLQWSMEDLNNQVKSEYMQAVSAYKGILAEYNALKENLALAEDVYNTLRLQYTAGIKTYLDVIIAETDLRSAQLNYLTALNEVLSSKLDMQRALGTVQY